MASPQSPEGTLPDGERPLIMRYAARSDVGRLRSKNDDSAYAGRHLAVVADGMGGHAGGDVASASTVLDMIHLDHDDYPEGADTVLADEIQTANSLLSELVHVDPKLAGMGTTVTALLLEGRKLHFAHIGDSRAYRLRGTTFEQISVDHTFVQRLIDEGRLRPEEAETHPHKNVLMRVLGDVDASPELDLNVLDVEAGERWLLCSDGLNYVPGPVVEQVVRETRNLAECAELLIQLTLANGAPDNVTVVMLEIAEETDDDVSTAAVEIVTPAADAPEDEASSAKAADSAEPQDADAPKAAGEPPAVTDPHLGEHLSAEVLREELASRPHELVGAAATAAETGSIPTVAGRSVARRAATMLTHKAEQDREEILVLPVRRRRWLTALAAAVLAIFMVAGLWLGYAWTQTRFYVGEYDNRVAIFNGISQRLGPIQFSKLESVTELQMSSLPEFQQQKVRQTVPAESLEAAQRIVQNLEKPDGKPTPTPTPTPMPTPSPCPAKPTASAKPAPGAKTTASPTPSPSPCKGVTP
ncbi:serine/threonine protein phosphatase [Arthrobacter sp. SW1]|uniref:PP2C family protein-serine/threonine phosphatase n=1 Tax=Arthrobacter sp. SW1 TaxID=1920889 RepID=UPI000877D763|nr:PP2C family serine/threonine-protein phosphatase [Arthrobacter sp. SW1]OFI36453.1 serine/threonine protein phosphatase [Arthrobacter sp. SW1]